MNCAIGKMRQIYTLISTKLQETNQPSKIRAPSSKRRLGILMDQPTGALSEIA